MNPQKLSRQATESSTPQLTLQGAVATIRLQRPQQHNRLDPQDLPVLRDHITTVSQNPNIHLLVLTGSGGKTFCSGYTVGAIVTQLDEQFEATLNAVEQCPLPTLCAVNGSVYGGGIDLALCCDFRLGLQGTQAFMPAARFALHYHPSGLRRFLQQLGPSVAKQMLLTGLTLQADNLLRSQFVLELLADQEQLQQRVDDFAQALSQCDLATVKSMKQQLNAMIQGQAAAFLDRSAYVQSLQSSQLKARLGVPK